MEPGARDFNAITGRIKPYRLWVLLGLPPSSERNSTCRLHHMPTMLSSKAELPVFPAQKAASQEMGHKCTLSFLMGMVTEKTRSISPHGEHTPGMAEIWQRRQIYVIFTAIPSIVLGFVISAKARCLVSSRGSTVKYEPITSIIALT